MTLVMSVAVGVGVNSGDSNSRLSKGNRDRVDNSRISLRLRRRMIARMQVSVGADGVEVDEDS